MEALVAWPWVLPFGIGGFDRHSAYVVLSVPSLVQFGSHWTVAKDAIRYLYAGSELALGRGLHTTHGLPFNGGHGPGLPALICALILIFGRDIAAIVWAVRLLALLNALLAYFLVKRMSGPLAGLIAEALRVWPRPRSSTGAPSARVFRCAPCTSWLGSCRPGNVYRNQRSPPSSARRFSSLVSRASRASFTRGTSLRRRRTSPRSISAVRSASLCRGPSATTEPHGSTTCE